MSPLDEGFRIRIENFFKYWQTAIFEALEKGQQQGIVDKSNNLEDCSQFILCAIEGALGMIKNQQNKAVYYSCGKELKRYLNSLKKQSSLHT